MEQKTCSTCKRELKAYDRFCDRCGAAQTKPDFSDAETIAADFVLNRLKACSVDSLESEFDPESNKTTVFGLLEDGAGRWVEFEVRVDPAARKVDAWRMNLRRNGSRDSVEN